MPNTIDTLLDKIADVRIAVYGDLCLDAYFILDPRGSEVSVETGLSGEAVAKQYYSLGGGANVIANVAALKPKAVRAIGAIGGDLFGREMRRQFADLGVDTAGLVEQAERFDTTVFGKRVLDGAEGARLDFGFFNERSEQTDLALLESLRDALDWADAVIVNQQVPGSMSERFVEGLNTLLHERPDAIVLLDTRHYGDRFENVIRKTNAVEAARLCGVDADYSDVVPYDDLKTYARQLFERSGRTVFCSRGPRGILGVNRNGLFEEPGVRIAGKTDPVGAGDTAASALACAMAAGATPREAARLANLAASVTVRKLYITGTASPEEVREAALSFDE
jgi:sugar/nucleoside kinase (ribokinase family)